MTRRAGPAPSGGGDGRVSLARALSKLGLASRSEAADLILAGRVAIDGRVTRDPARRVVPERMHFEIDGVPAVPPPTRTILLHKPKGVVTTRRDPEGRPTVYDLIADAGPGLAPVGRLDLASAGLLVCTTDTQFAAWLTDPASGVAREYVVTVRGRVRAEDTTRMTGGLDVDGERLQADRVSILKASGRETHLRVVLREGRNREVRRLLAAVGHEVTRLLRVRIGGLALGALPAGHWQNISAKSLAVAFPEYPLGRSPNPRQQGRSARSRARHGGHS